MHLAPPPNSRDLLPPLFACLPTAFISPRPPPALLPLLSPLLRQRVNFLSSDTSAGGGGGWLSLLSWDARRASRLPAVVERMQLEPHPVSGEIELDDVGRVTYRRLDPETLHSRLEVEQFDLLPIYVWCENDEHGGTGPGWKLAELRTLDDKEDDGAEWFDTPAQAGDAAGSSTLGAPESHGTANGHSHLAVSAHEDDDDYWASYDRTPGRTPGPRRSPAPPASHAFQTNGDSSQSELDYFARYGAEVQPAMDAHDPDEEHADVGESTLTGDALVRAQARQVGLANDHPPPPLYPDEPKGPYDSAIASALNGSPPGHLSMPRPISQTSSHSSVDKLEEQAAAMSTTDVASDRAQRGIKQHISTDIKSLFRLAKSAGMERQEFDQIVRRELDVLSLLEHDE